MNGRTPPSLPATLQDRITLAPGSTATAAQRLLARAFADAGLDTPDLDVRVLIAHALGRDRSPPATDRVLTSAEAARISDVGARRLRREPVALILGEKEFWSLPLAVTGDTLVPRPETETVVEAALAALPVEARNTPLRIADLGTGSGAILLALLSELPRAYGVGVDISPAALAVARVNAARLGLGGRCTFLIGDFAAALGGGFGLVVSNPPYVASGAMAGLAAEVRDHEPRRALDGGADGLDAYRAIARDAARVIGPAGRLVLEIGQGQEADVTSLLGRAGCAPLGPARRDLAGVARALVLASP